MNDEQLLLVKIFELWDRADRGEISAADLKAYRQIVEIFYKVAQSGELMARADLIRAKSILELESSSALPAGDTLKLVENNA